MACLAPAAHRSPNGPEARRTRRRLRHVLFNAAPTAPPNPPVAAPTREASGTRRGGTYAHYQQGVENLPATRTATRRWHRHATRQSVPSEREPGCADELGSESPGGPFHAVPGLRSSGRLPRPGRGGRAQRRLPPAAPEV